MSWTQLLISLLTILISGLSAYLGAKRGKTASFRQALYAKQIEAVSELSVATYKMLVAENLEDSKAAFNDFWLIRRKWSAYLPDEIENALTVFALATRNADNQKLGQRMSSNWDHEKAGKIYDRQMDAYIDVDKSFRKLIGVEPLSKETLALFTPKSSDGVNSITLMKE
jgi:hypothetical protein